MANLTRTAANVRLMSAGPISPGTSGEAITQGDPLYFDTAGKLKKCQADGTAAEADCKAIALSAASAADMDVAYFAPGADIDLGATLTVGETYVVSATAGAICPVGDLVSGDYVTILGIATAANKLPFRPRASGVEKP